LSGTTRFEPSLI